MPTHLPRQCATKVAGHARTAAFHAKQRFGSCVGRTGDIGGGASNLRKGGLVPSWYHEQWRAGLDQRERAAFAAFSSSGGVIRTRDLRVMRCRETLRWAHAG